VASQGFLALHFLHIFTLNILFSASGNDMLKSLYALMNGKQFKACYLGKPYRIQVPWHHCVYLSYPL